MEENKLKDLIRTEIEAEAAALEQKVTADPDWKSEMPELSFEDVLRRAEAARTAAASAEPARTSNVKPFRLRKRALLAVALVAILLAAVGLGTTGAKLFVPKVENRGKDGEMSIKINNDEDTLVREITEEEAYEEIEDKIGILALRLGSKLNGMELGKVYIDEVSGEASMEFYYGEHILTVYENKQSSRAAIGTQPDGTVVDEIEIFHLGQTIPIVEIDKGNGEVFYRTEFEYGNAYYYLACDTKLEEFESVLMGIIFENV